MFEVLEDLDDVLFGEGVEDLGLLHFVIIDGAELDQKYMISFLIVSIRISLSFAYCITNILNLLSAFQYPIYLIIFLLHHTIYYIH